MKKILFFIDGFPSYSETFLYNQIYYLLNKGFDVGILALKRREELSIPIHGKMSEYGLNDKCFFLQNSIEFNILFNLLFHPIFSYRILKFWDFKKSIFLIRNLNLLLSYSNYDVIHAHYGHVGSLVCDLKAIGFYANVRIICSFHGEDVSHNLPNTHTKKYSNIGRLADVITVNSKYTYDCLIKSVSDTWQNIVIVPVPVDVNYFKPSSALKEQSKCFKIIFCGRLIESKAPTFAIEIVRELIRREHPVKFDIIGNGPESHACEELIINSGLEDYIKLLGSLSQEDILSKFEQADVFLFPCIRESKTLKTEAQGLVLQEAQAMGLPVIISNVGGMKYGMKDGITGYVVEEHDLTGFVNKLVELIENPSLMDTMSSAGRTYVEDNFDVEVIGSKMLELYGLTRTRTNV